VDRMTNPSNVLEFMRMPKVRGWLGCCETTNVMFFALLLVLVDQWVVFWTHCLAFDLLLRSVGILIG